jgi:hypothetical protein
MSFAPPVKDINQMSNGEMASYGSDLKLMVTFTREPMLMGFESEKAGKPVYEDRDYITIVQPGAKSDSKRAVKMEDDHHGPSDPNRFPRQWAAFKNQTLQVADGLPLENWPPIGMSPAAIKGFKAADIFTVEQLSALPDSAVGGIPVMDARKWRDLAIKYQEQAAGGAPIAALTAENNALKQDMEIMRAQIAELAANQKQKPGRKPNNSDEGE